MEEQIFEDEGKVPAEVEITPEADEPTEGLKDELIKIEEEGVEELEKEKQELVEKQREEKEELDKKIEKGSVSAMEKLRSSLVESKETLEMENLSMKSKNKVLSDKLEEVMKELNTVRYDDTRISLHEDDRPLYVLSNRQKTKPDDYFGLCPVRKGTNEPIWLNVHKGNVAHYPVCKTRWDIGWNLFSSWRHETEAVWMRNAEPLQACKEVEPYFHRSTRFRCWWNRKTRWIARLLPTRAAKDGLPF